MMIIVLYDYTIFLYLISFTIENKNLPLNDIIWKQLSLKFCIFLDCSNGGDSFIYLFNFSKQ